MTGACADVGAVLQQQQSNHSAVIRFNRRTGLSTAIKLTVYCASVRCNRRGGGIDASYSKTSE
jgi:hypothetical protein